MKWWLLLALLACSRSERVAKSAPVHHPQVQPLPAVPRVSPSKLDAWLRYHRELSSALRDGGLNPRLVARAELEVRARHGLSEAELDLIEDCVSSVLTLRSIARLSGTEAIANFERVSGSLGPERRRKVDSFISIPPDGGSLAAVRQKCGEEAVALVFAREAELSATWNALFDEERALP